ncbi:DNA polymerase III subunit epsilon [Anaplasma phagocytophilum]|uniref:DNA polymerase III subunit epsilon n=1 Tax=Anaplasma phagocytophilum TaxID=948 RepID=UPI00201ABE2B
MKVREIVLDTETTGLDADGGDRIIEIGCVELVDYVMTGRVFHKYIDPERDISVAATRVHGITRESLIGMPKFAEVADELLDFLRDSALVIHNARFDMRFLEVEIELLRNKRAITNTIVDTLEMARKKFPGMPASLDALCKRFNISTQERKFHGALKDATLLARVYVELLEALQRRLVFSQEGDDGKQVSVIYDKARRVVYPARTFTLSDEEKMLHRQTVSKMKNPIWLTCFDEKEFFCNENIGS